MNQPHTENHPAQESSQGTLWPAGDIGFDNERYLADQAAAIARRVAEADGRLYLEFGGKLLYDMHAARVLPGYDPNVKVRLLQRLRNDADIILCIYAADIDKRKMRGDFGITYESDAFKLIDDLRERGLDITAVVITRFEGQSAAMTFRSRLERRGIRVFLHGPIQGYPGNLDLVISDRGYGANPYIPVTRPLVVVTGPGPNSGKMATCLSQVYHEHQRGMRAAYAKFETFPIWNLPLRHPVNIAYEAATADIRDFNMIDPFHLEAYNEQAVNYNRDVETFPVLRAILERITGARLVYRSPTDMGVNRAGFAIVNDALVRAAAAQEIVRRYFRYACEHASGIIDEQPMQRVEMLMKEVNVTPLDRRCVAAAREAAEAARREGTKGDNDLYVGAAIELADGSIITGVNSPLMHASSAAVLNAIKHLAEIPRKIRLLPPSIIESVAHLKHDVFGRRSVSLDLEETLIALSIAALNNPAAELAMQQLKRLQNRDMHLTHMPTPGDETGLRRLGLNLTADPVFATSRLFVV